MTCERSGASGLDYMPCRYGTSKTLFRGPKRKLTDRHLLFLGGTETYGKFMQSPYPALVEDLTGLAAVNLGVVNAGPDLYLHDRGIMEMTRHAEATVIQVTGTQNLSNRYYSVHPRRNDRFLQASPMLRTIFRDVDFARFHFTRHMLKALEALSPDRFAILRVELQQAWVARMRQLIADCGSPVILFWFADRPPAKEGCPQSKGSYATDPLFVTAEMIEALRPEVAAVVTTAPSAEALADRTEGLVFSQMEAQMAGTLLGAKAHREAAATLAAALADIHPAAQTSGPACN